MKNNKANLLSILVIFISFVYCEEEIITKRGFYSKVFSLGNGIEKIEISSRPIHYRNVNNEFIDIPQNPSELSDSLRILAYSQMGNYPFGEWTTMKT